MKYIAFFVSSFFLLWQSYAGLFEYTMWEKTRINTTKYESVDLVEALDIWEKYYPSYTKNLWFQQKTIFADDYYSHSSGYYYNTDDIVSEMQYYISIANSLRNDISKMRKYWSEYNTLRNQLKRDLSDLEDQIDYLSELRTSLTRHNTSYYTNRYYDTDLRSQRLTNYYRKYWFDYSDSSYYYYDSHLNYFQRKPSWLNENLKPRDEWYIYIQ